MELQVRQRLNLMLAKVKRLKRKAFRIAFVRSNIEQGIAHQIRLLRQAKGWSQGRLAKEIGVKGQSAIARLEDPGYGRYNVATLLKVATAFDVALMVRFVSYGKLLSETADLSPTALCPESFNAECSKMISFLTPRPSDIGTSASKFVFVTRFEQPKLLMHDTGPTHALGSHYLASVGNLRAGTVPIVRYSSLTPAGASQWLQ